MIFGPFYQINTTKNQKNTKLSYKKIDKSLKKINNNLCLLLFLNNQRKESSF